MNSTALALLLQELVYLKPDTSRDLHVPVRKVPRRPPLSCRDCFFYASEVCKSLDCNLAYGDFIFVVS